jgi:soluble lytic murein transglycosylase-like protein
MTQEAWAALSPETQRGVQRDFPEAMPQRQAAARSEDPQGDAIARVVGIPRHLMDAVQQRENPGRDPRIVSGDPSGPGKGGAVGMMQLLPGTFESLRPEIERLIGRKAVITNPLDNRLAGALYLRQGLDRSGGDVEAAARYYHGGPSALQHGPRTQAYGQAIAQNFRR